MTVPRFGNFDRIRDSRIGLASPGARTPAAGVTLAQAGFPDTLHERFESPRFLTEKVRAGGTLPDRFALNTIADGVVIDKVGGIGGEVGSAPVGSGSAGTMPGSV
jgi:hypothetical protein